MNDFAENKARKIERYMELAEKNREESDRRYKAARQIGDMIPFGQPILVGHHSEGRHRRDLGRIDGNMRASIEAEKKAKYYEQKARSAESNRAIFSEDPEAVVKLKAKIDALEKLQAYMKEANRILRKKDIPGLVAHVGEARAAELQKPDFAGRTGFAGYQLTNNNANIRRMNGRLKELESKQGRETKEWELHNTHLDVKVVENIEENRIQLFFPIKPNENARKNLKSHGFRWAPSVGAWQRHLNAAGIFKAKEILKFLCVKDQYPFK